MIAINVKPWARFSARFSIKQELETIGRDANDEFRKGISFGPKTGRIYDGIRASAPGEFPARRSGNLYRSIDYKVEKDELTVGSKMPYSPRLVEMFRLMSEESLELALKKRRQGFYHSFWEHS